MEMSKFILLGDILIMKVKIDGVDYTNKFRLKNRHK